MCIGNTNGKISYMGQNTVYPYVYREHLITDQNRHHIRGLSLCV